MNVDIISILSSHASTAITEIRNHLQSTGTNATGKTSKSLKFTVTGSDKVILEILGRNYFGTVETGRKATPNFTKPSFEFVASIKEWAKAKGFSEVSAYAIAKSIHKKGTKLHQTGGRHDIISNVLNQDFTDKIAKDILKQFANLFLTNVKHVYGNSLK